MCRVMPLKFPPVVACGKTVDKEKELVCTLVKGHPRWVPCRPSRTKREANPMRDGTADPLDKGHNPTFEQRHRVGPHR